MDASSQIDPLGWMDRFLLAVAPRWARRRIQDRTAGMMLARHYEAARVGRRTSGWKRSATDANAANLPSLAALRWLARDLQRNNGWARNGIRAIVRNTVGWGIMAKPTGKNEAAKERARQLWREWAETTKMDADGRVNFYGLQSLALATTVVSGEVLIRRRRRRPGDELPLPIQLQVLESDFIDTMKDGVAGPGGGPIIQGVEFDLLGRRVAYWLFEEHPGSSLGRASVSRRVPAEDIIHLFDLERPGQVRGPSWLGAAIISLRDFDDYEDAMLMRQKIAACFAAFVTDTDGSGDPLGAQTDDPLIESLEPGMISYLAPGQDVTFATPPIVQDSSFSVNTLRRIAAALGVTYEDLTGDYSNVNFSSSRMARIAHWGNVHNWRWNMLIPHLCDGVWQWAMEAAEVAGLLVDPPSAEWTPPPMPMLEPDKEGLAYTRQVRSGAMTHDEMVRELGGDPDTHWDEYAEGLKRLDRLGIVIDSDARKVTVSGQKQSDGGSSAEGED